MKLTINKLHIPDLEENEVKSSKVFVPGKILDKNGNFRFHEEGIFSEKIFGRFKKCNCVTDFLTRPGICPKCNVRVLSKKRMPIFFIKFNNLDIPDFALKNLPSGVTKLLHYKGFLYKENYEWKYFDLDLDKLDLSSFNPDNVLIGKEAAKQLGYYVDDQISNKIVIPHTSMRRIQGSTTNKSGLVLGYLNTLYIDLLVKKEKLETLRIFEDYDVFTELMLKSQMIEAITEIRRELVTNLTQGKRSIVDKELRGQKLVGAIRAVVINNHSVDEDDIYIGKYFIKQLYPTVAKQFLLENGEYDIPALNKYLRENDYLVLVNRQPSIGAKSIIAARPVFSEKDSEQFIVQVNSIICDGLAMDMDGDCLSVISLFTKQANKEALKLLTSVNYVEGSDGSVRQAYPEDFAYVKTRLEKEEKA